MIIYFHIIKNSIFDNITNFVFKNYNKNSKSFFDNLNLNENDEKAINILKAKFKNNKNFSKNNSFRDINKIIKLTIKLNTIKIYEKQIRLFRNFVEKFFKIFEKEIQDPAKHTSKLIIC